MLMMGLIFVFSSIPMKLSPPSMGSFKLTPDLLLRKSGHLLGYALSDEFHQSFVPVRSASLIDVGIDLLGAVVGLVYAPTLGIVLNTR